MKVLVVCQYYKPEPFRISDICEALAEAGHAVTVVTGTPNYPEGIIYEGYENGAHGDEVIGGVRVHRCPLIPRKTGALYRFLNYYSFVFSAHKFLRQMEDDFDVVFVNQLSPVMMAEPALKWAKRHGKKCVLYCLDLWPESLTAGGIGRSSPIYKLFYPISRKIYRAADHILVTSKGFVPYLRDYIQAAGPYTYLPQYAEELFGQVPEYVPHEGPYHFVFAGNIGDMQSVETIIEAAALLKGDGRAVFDIVGDGVALTRCREMADGLPNVVFHGRRDVSEMERFYTMADAMLVSLKDNPVMASTLPGKVQSYMAAGRTVVGSIGGETASLIAEANCGVCAAPENSRELAEKIRELLDAPERFALYGKNAKAYYQDTFRKEAFMQKLISVLSDHCG
ncbi:MAG: glycosyltransferase family 4 protein [Oscillospiraceae bacterium]|nr:glycosyltransferase family 4 protein [Oscillospiraceae bacterium]